MRLPPGIIFSGLMAASYMSVPSKDLDSRQPTTTARSPRITNCRSKSHPKMQQPVPPKPRPRVPRP